MANVASERQSDNESSSQQDNLYIQVPILQLKTLEANLRFYVAFINVTIIAYWFTCYLTLLFNIVCVLCKVDNGLVYTDILNTY